MLKKFILVFFAVIALAAMPFFVKAQTATNTTASQPEVCNNPTSSDIAQACLEYTQETQKLKQLQDQLAKQKATSGSLQKNVNALLNQILKTQNQIKNQINTIGLLTKEIGQKSQAIDALQNELDLEHQSMAELLTRTDDIDQKGVVYLLLSSQSVSNFYQDLDYFYSIKESLYASLNQVKQIKASTENQKSQLQDAQSQALDAENALKNQKAQLSSSQEVVQSLLNSSKSAEQTESTLVAQEQQKVAAIESKLFSFAGGGTAAIPFKDAYAYATEASTVTGVEPAFILAILTQESDLGKNVGTCNRPGDPPSKSYLNVMNPTRDQPIFLQITAALGLDPNTTPISCPIGGGWGGAMGPAQFIPSTWELIASRVASALGETSANPWSARDAIMASALYLEDRGAAGGNATVERNAACRYYSGRSCDGKRPPNSFYGNSVMALTRSIQSDIDYLNQYGVAKQ